MRRRRRWKINNSKLEVSSKGNWNYFYIVFMQRWVFMLIVHVRSRLYLLCCCLFKFLLNQWEVKSLHGSDHVLNSTEEKRMCCSMFVNNSLNMGKSICYERISLTIDAESTCDVSKTFANCLIRASLSYTILADVPLTSMTNQMTSIHWIVIPRFSIRRRQHHFRFQTVVNTWKTWIEWAEWVNES